MRVCVCVCVCEVLCVCACVCVCVYMCDGSKILPQCRRECAECKYLGVCVCVCFYLIYKHTLGDWLALQRYDVQVGCGGQSWLHHGDQRLLWDACDLGSKGTSLASCDSTDVWNCRSSMWEMCRAR